MCGMFYFIIKKGFVANNRDETGQLIINMQERVPSEFKLFISY